MKVFSHIIYWYFSRRALPYWCVFILDCLLVFLSAFAVYSVVKSPGLVSFRVSSFTLLLYTSFYAIGFLIFRTYAGIIRYSSFVDLLKVAQATIFGMVMSFVFRALFRLNDLFAPIHIEEIVLWSLIATGILWSIRVVIKYLYDNFFRVDKAERVFIYGVKQGGVSIAKSLRNQDPAQYVVAGFVSDIPDVIGRQLMGVKVYAANDSLVDTMKSHNAKALFVSPIRSEALRENQSLVDALIEAGIKIFMVPYEMQWDGKSDINHTQMREVQIEELLPRDKIEIDIEGIGNMFSGKSILITGAAGSIGGEMVRQIAMFNPGELILIDQAETPLHEINLMMKRDFPAIKSHIVIGDIANREHMRAVFSQHKPQYVFHAAAYKHVPMMEDNPAESVRNNVEGTRVIADLAVEFGTLKFVMISTDKAVNPTNVMGCSKRICEIYVQSLDKYIKEGKVKGVTQFVTTRFGNVLGSNGSVIPLFREQIRNGGPITVTHPEIIRYFMLIPEACKLVLEAGVMGNGGEIFAFDMGAPVKIVDLARRMINLSGVDIEIKFTGLREGEKLYEEVLNEKETCLPTFHPKIMIAKVLEYDYDTVNASIDDLYAASLGCDDMEVVKRMKAIVPEYKSQHSRFSVLD